MQILRVLAAGSTTWTNREIIRRELATLPPGSILVHGDAPGADALAGEIAQREYGLVVVRMQKNAVDRSRHGQFAWRGLNERMLQQGISLVLAFHTELHDANKAHGTRHLITLAEAQGIEVRIISE